MFHFLRGLFERKVLSTATAWPLLFTSHVTASAVAVTEQNVMACPAARGAVAVLAESVAQLPLHLYRRTGEDGRERASDHPLYSILLNAANDWTSAFEFRRNMMVSLLLSGHAFAFVNRSRATGEVVELIQLPTGAVQLYIDDATGEPHYFVQDPSRREIDRSQILHLQALNGESPLLQVREAIGLSLTIEQHQARLFANGARPSGLLKLKHRLPPAVSEKLGADFNLKWGGLASSGRTMVLEDGAEFDALTFSSVDLQMLELRKFQVAEIARALRIPLHLLGDWERATWSNAETAGRQFLSFTLLPWLELWQQGIARALLSPEERRVLYAEFVVDDLVRADISGRFEAYAKAVSNGILTANEVRAMENRPPLPGGDDLRSPLNTAPSDQTEPVA
jgi:HK97 family phage portal protein